MRELSLDNLRTMLVTTNLINNGKCQSFTETAHPKALDFFGERVTSWLEKTQRHKFTVPSRPNF